MWGPDYNLLNVKTDFFLYGYLKFWDKDQSYHLSFWMGSIFHEIHIVTTPVWTSSKDIQYIDLLDSQLTDQTEHVTNSFIH